MGQPAIEEHSSVFFSSEPCFDQRPFPRFTTSLTVVKIIKRPVVPRSTIHENDRFTATPPEDLFDEQQGVEVRSAGRDLDVDYFKRFRIDCCPDVDLSIFEFQLGFIDSDSRMVVRNWVEEVRQVVTPLAHGLL